MRRTGIVPFPKLKIISTSSKSLKKQEKFDNNAGLAGAALQRAQVAA
jgi:hypothetical protein